MKKILLTITAIVSILIMLQSCAITDNGPTDDITKYVGTWSVSDQSARLNYSVTITANPSNSSEILLSNFADLGNTATALVVGNSVEIDNQSLGSDYTVQGSGSYISDKKLEFSFTLNDGIDTESRTATFTK